MRLTKINISKVSVPYGKNEIIQFDDDVPGFGLRIRVGGSRSWIFQYRQGNKQRRLSLGAASAITVADARTRASQLHARVKLGQDPGGEKIENRVRAIETFGSVLKPYLMHKKAALKLRTYAEVERHLLQHAKWLHGMQVTAIDRRTVAALLAELAANNGPTVANSVRASLSSFFSWSMREGLAEANPVIATNKAAANGARERVTLNLERTRYNWLRRYRSTIGLNGTTPR